MDSSFDAIITKDLDGIVTSWNPRPSGCSATPPAEMVGQPIRLLIPPERQSEEDDILAQIRQGERVEHFETVRVAKDGRRLNLSL